MTEIRAAAKANTSLITCGEPVQITAAEGGEGEGNQLASFEMVAYAGGKMKPGGWWQAEPLVLDISGMKFESQKIPIFLNHSDERIVGHSEQIAAGRKLVIKGKISAANAHAVEVVASSKNGFPWQASVGANLVGEPKLIPAGETVNVNGRTMAGPFWLAKRSLIKEASFVSLGADSRTSAVAAKDENMNEFEKWLQAQGIDHETLSEDAYANLQAAWQSQQGASQDDDDDDKADGGRVAAGARRDDAAESSDDDDSGTLAASKAAMKAHYERVGWIEEHLTDHPKLKAKALDEEWSEDRIKLEAMRAKYTGRGPAIHVVDTSVNASAIECQMAIAAGMRRERVERHYDAKTLEATRRVPRSAGLHYLCHQVIRAAGGHADSGVFDNDTIRAAFQADRQITAAGGFSTVSLSGTLSNLANKMLLDAYSEVPSVIGLIAAEVDHNDFKQHTKYRITSPGALEKLGPTGEIKHTELDEDTYSNQVETFAEMLALTRTMMINDDLGAFLRIPAMFGAMAARTRERSVFEVLLDNTDGFFDDAATVAADGHLPNALAAGAGSALSGSSLGEAEKLYWEQVDKHGNPIMVEPSVLLTPPAIYRDAVNLVNATTVNVVGDPTSGEQTRVSNEYLGEFTPTKSPWAGSNSGLTGGSDTQWWLFGRPSASVAALEVAYLRGRRTPTIESAETDFNTLGMQWRAYWDWGVAKQDPRGAVYSPGA